MSYSGEKKEPIRITAEHKYVGFTGIEVWFELQRMEDGFFHSVLCARNGKYTTHRNIVLTIVGVRPSYSGSNEYVRIFEGITGYEDRIRNRIFREKGWVFFIERVRNLWMDGEEDTLWDCYRTEWYFKNMVL